MFFAREAMRSSRCVFNTATALHRVFVAPIEHTQLSFAQRTTFGLSIQSRLGPPLSQRRNYYVVDSKAEKSRLPRNNEITAYSVIVVNDDGSLLPPRQTKAVLEELDLSKVVLQTVVAGDRDKPPICKVQSKAVLRATEKLRKKNERKGAIGGKTIELNWAIDKGDLKHRLNKLKEFLEKGLRVDVLMATKRKGKRALEHEAMEVVQKIEEAMTEVGAKEYKVRDGKLLQQLTIYIEGKKPSKSGKGEVENTDENPEVPKVEGTEPEQAQKKRRMRWKEPAVEVEGEGGVGDGALAEALAEEKSEQLQKAKHFQKRKAPPFENPALAALKRAASSHKKY